MVSQRKSEPYNLDPSFERAVCGLICRSPKFYGRIGYALDASALSGDAARLVVEAAQAIAREIGHGPEDGVLVAQRLRRWMHEGRVSYEQIVEVVDLLDAADDTPVPEDSVVAELAPILKRRLEAEAVRDAMSEYSKRGDLDRVVEKITAAKRVGVMDTSTGTVLSARASFEEIRRLRYVDRLSFGVMELDMKTDGGLWRGAIGVAIAGYGGGKSMFLAQLACAGFLQHYHVGFLTLELATGLQLARIKSNLVGIPTNLIISGQMELEAMERMEELVVDRQCRGDLAVKYMAGGVATVSDVRDWIKAREDEAGRAMDLLVVDYADKITSPKDKSTYDAMKSVYQGLANIAAEGKRWVWTASQATRGNRQRKRVTGDDIADSINKMRVVDMGISVNLQDDQSQVEFMVTKNRLGKGGETIGPLPVELECGRIAPVVR